ncbi:MAG: winged helix DNA-binding domain-containing protein [Firmicutes bacterium]|nr:winged helix DNA-binding domain-containing protein [Bacillota bacterium]
MPDKEFLLYQSLRGQHLIGKAPKNIVVSELCGLQAQFQNNPGHALRVRAEDFTEPGWSGGLVKLWTLRGTLHAVLESEAGLFLSARPAEHWDDSWDIPREVKPYWAEFILDQVKSGNGEREHLKKACADQGMEPELLSRVFYGWGGLLSDMCRRGLVAYSCGAGKRFVPLENVSSWERDTARAEILRRYFWAYGLATLSDCQYFTYYKRAEILRLIEKFSLPLKSLILDSKEYFYLQEHESGADIPHVLFLAGFDQLLLGYKDRTRMMREENRRDVTTNTGIVMPTLLVDGLLSARWKKNASAVAIAPFRKISAVNRKRVVREAERLFGAVAVKFETS